MSRHRSSSLSSSTRRLLTLVVLVACLVVALSPILVRAQECQGGECTSTGEQFPSEGPPEGGPSGNNPDGPPSGPHDGPQDMPSDEQLNGPSDEQLNGPSSDGQSNEPSDGQSNEPSAEPQSEGNGEQSNTSDETSDETLNETSNGNLTDDDALKGANSTDDAFLSGDGISYTGPGVGSLDKGFSVTIIVIVVIIALASIGSVAVWWYRKRQIKHDWKRLTTYHEQQHSQRNSLFGGASSIPTGGGTGRSVAMSTAPLQSPRVVEEARGYHITSELERPSIESGGQSAVGSSSHLANPVTSTSVVDPGGGSNTSSQAQLQAPSIEDEATLYTAAPSTSSVDISAEGGIEQRPSEHTEPGSGGNEQQ